VALPVAVREGGRRSRRERIACNAELGAEGTYRGHEQALGGGDVRGCNAMLYAVEERACPSLCRGGEHGQGKDATLTSA
jgi:hypothetical protein